MPTTSRKSHGHLDEEEIPEAGNLIVHWHEGGEQPHRHAYKMIGGPAPRMRWMPPSYIERREAEGWDDV
jgi:hypothetical protein